MKKILLLLGFIALFNSIFINRMYAARISVGPQDKLIKILDLPNTEDYTSTDGQLFDFGYKYTLFEIVFLPLFEKGEGQIVGYIDDDNYVVLSDSDIQDIVKRNKIGNLAGMVKIPFWDLWGGKIVAITIVFLLILWIIRSRDKDIAK